MWIVATFVLTVGFVDDLRSRKVHNSVVLALLSATIVISLYARGIEGSLTGVTAFLLALVITIPLFTLRVIGGGDVKLFAVFALALEPMSTFWTLIYSVIWGAVFGLVHVSLHRQLPTLVRNTLRTVSSRHKVQAQELQKIPYTFAYLLGWFTQLTFLKIGGAF